MERLRAATREDWSLRSLNDALVAFDARESGLSQTEAKARHTAFGANEIAQGKPTPWYIMLGRQFANPLVYILLIAAVVTGLMQHYSDVVIILAVLVINAAIGFYQESKAERAINNIKGMSAPRCRAKRDGQVHEIVAVELVPGDVIVLEEGDRIPADARLLSVSRLRVEEAIFTGETCAADKTAGELTEVSVLADKTNMVFMGTHITSGRGEALITAIGMGTELGKIAGLVQAAEDVQTPLTKKLTQFTNQVAKSIIGVCAIIFVSSYLIHKQEFGEVLLNAIALAVSAIPEGLPIVVTLVLAIGVRRMANHQALIRKLPTVETLGSATVICTDKTGTLTRNEMVVTHLFTGEREYLVSGDGYAPIGTIVAEDGEAVDTAKLTAFAESAVLCNNAALHATADGAWEMVGDATEGALITLGGKITPEFITLRDTNKRLAEIPFDSQSKFMVAVHEQDGRSRAHLKGSLESVISRCDRILGAQGVRALSDRDLATYEELNLRLAGEALRVLALAALDLPEATDLAAFPDSEQHGYVFLGVIGMMDLPRPEAAEAVKTCRKAGIRCVMITGDHAATARAVGERVGLYDADMKVVTGQELEKMDDAALRAIVQDVAVYARTSPEHKMRIIQAWQHHRHVVSMTGDGVNDAPALTRADIGVAMGRSGTDVSREAAGMVLMNDNFASIVAAVEEGRIIFNNLRKAIAFLVGTNAGEVLTLLSASLLGLPAPLRAVEILWVNLVTDGFTTIALGVDPAEGDEMTRPPRDPDAPMISRPMRVQVLIVAVLMTIGTLLAWYLGREMVLATSTPNMDEATAAALQDLARRTGETMAFGAMVFFQLFNIFNCRSDEKSLFTVGVFSNMTLVGAVLLASLLQFGAIYLPFMQGLLKTVSLDGIQLFITIGIAFTVIPVIELVKFWNRRKPGQAI